MSIIITGLEMPTERESFNLTIMYNGTVLDTETGMQVAEAYELSPHGRLIDADALIEKDNVDYNLVVNTEVSFATKSIITHLHYQVREMIQDAPTIIPAEEGE